MSSFPTDSPEVSAASLRFSAMNCLARREHSAEELRQKLRRRCDDENLIEQVVAQLRKDKLQCDERYAEAFMTMRIRQGKGPVRIAQELRQKGVSEELLSALLDPSDSLWWDLAREVRERRFGGERPESPKDKAKQMRFLQYRGFTSDQIRTLFP
ncbi:regulatory protein RecX [Marinimicrobium sp. ABcell2]|uniref:regulatory protein RecX n=1 Tax=Marinimicrobium sp. ABcell2 TaxID=3069751 RepID=UPI0027B0CD6D|nr:regulatory protein RecX [Marinimicrobium sp. ABcell2]MDQ2075417.1 regulatory protein RecX [Marinimicrobium sp. ABcell2]